jgi:5-methylcytosine-specific restriction endonuclease McrA
VKPPLPQPDAALARARRLLHDQRTRARKDGAVLDYGLADVRHLLADSPCCSYCGVRVAWDVSLDHRTPTGRGGQHQLANVAVCCGRCVEWHLNLEKTVTMEKLGSYPACPDSR